MLPSLGCHRERAALPGGVCLGAQMHFFVGGLLSVVGRKGKKPVWRSDLLKVHSVHTLVVSQLHLATAEVALLRGFARVGEKHSPSALHCPRPHHLVSPVGPLKCISGNACV